MDFFAPETLPFAVALCVTGGIALMEVAGLLFGASASAAIDSALPDIDVPDAPGVEPVEMGTFSHVLSWLSFGRVPALVILILFTAAFGISGFLVQGAVQQTLGFMLHPALASVPALIGAAYGTRWGGRLVGRIIPREQSDAVSTAEFVGRVATIIRGEARPGEPAEAKLKDIRGKTHYLLVEPDDATQSFAQGSEVVIVRQAGHVYHAITRLKPAAQ